MARDSPSWPSILAAASLLLWPAVWNRYPIVFADTGTYLSQAINHYAGWDRPVFYSLFMLPLHATLTVWPVVVAQALLTAWLLRTVCLVLVPGLSGWLFVTGVAGLALFTWLPWLVSELMPDLFTPLLVLVLGLLCVRRHRFWLVPLAACMIATQQSSLPLAVGLGLGLGGLRWVWKLHWNDGRFHICRFGLTHTRMPSLPAVMAGEGPPSTAFIVGTKAVDGGHAATMTWGRGRHVCECLRGLILHWNDVPFHICRFGLTHTRMPSLPAAMTEGTGRRPINHGLWQRVKRASALRDAARSRRIIPIKASRCAGLALPPVLAVLALCSVNLLAHGRFSISPYGNIFLLARMIDDGPATDILRRDCPGAGWRLCAFAGRLPMASDDFLWTQDSPMNQAGGPKLLSSEAGAIIEAALLADPRGVAAAAIANTARQLTRFESGDGLQAWPDQVTPWIRRDFPPAEYGRYEAASQQAGRLAVPWPLGLLHKVTGIAGIAACLALLPAALRRRHVAALFIVLALLALPVSAAITGALSAPHDRYQARIMWLPPFIAATSLVSLRRRRA